MCQKLEYTGESIKINESSNINTGILFSSFIAS